MNNKKENFIELYSYYEELFSDYCEERECLTCEFRNSCTEIEGMFSIENDDIGKYLSILDDWNSSQPSYLDKLREAFPLISEDCTPSFCPSELGFKEIHCEGKHIPADCYSCWRSRIPKKEE